MATLDELVVRIKGDMSHLERELKRTGVVAQQATGQMAAGFAAVSRSIPLVAAALAALNVVGFARNAVAAADALNDLSARSGVSAEFLSAMRTEIENAGGTVEQFAQSLFFMNRQLGEAIKDAGGPAAQAFRQLGLSVGEMLNSSPEENFRLIADAISRLPTEFERAEASAALFGRGVAGIQPIIRDGAAGIDAIVEAAERLGLKIGEEQLDAIDRFGDGMNTLGDRLQVLAAGTFADIVIAVEDITSAVRDGVGQIQLLKAGGLEALAWAEKARAGGASVNNPNGPTGFVTEATRAEFVSSQPYGPNMPRRPAAPRAPARASAERKEAVQEIRELTVATEEFGVEMERVEDQAVVSARVLKDSFGDALESATFDFENFGDAASGVLDGLARNIARKGFIDPLSGGLDSLLFGGGGVTPRPSPDFVGPMPMDGGLLGDIFGSAGSIFGFAGGGRPPVGRPSIVGERGPEIFVPDAAGTVLPNGAGMGGVSVTNHYHFQSGMTKQEVMALMPMMEQRCIAGTLGAIEKGGRASQIVGRRG